MIASAVVLRPAEPEALDERWYLYLIADGKYRQLHSGRFTVLEPDEDEWVEEAGTVDVDDDSLEAVSALVSELHEDTHEVNEVYLFEYDPDDPLDSWTKYKNPGK